jgi:hypothetical protein
MNREQVKKGNNLIRVLENIELAIVQCNTAIVNVEENELKRTSSDFAGGYNSVLGNYMDMSGFHVDMTGCYVQLDMYIACLDVLTKKKALLEVELEAI